MDPLIIGLYLLGIGFVLWFVHEVLKALDLPGNIRAILVVIGAALMLWWLLRKAGVPL